MSKWKKMWVLLVAMSLLCTVAACGNKDEKKEEGKKEQGVKITETYTHQDPEHVTFDSRKVLHVPGKSEYFSMLSKKLSVEGKEGYFVVYGNGEKPVAVYEYLVFANEKQAKTYQTYAKTEHQKVNVQDEVVFLEKSGKELDAEIQNYKKIGLFETGSTKEYIKFVQDTFFAENVK